MRNWNKEQYNNIGESNLSFFLTTNAILTINDYFFFCSFIDIVFTLGFYIQ